MQHNKRQEMDVMMLWAFLGHLPIHAPRPFATPTPVYHALRPRTSFNRPSPHPPVVYLLPSPSPFPLSLYTPYCTGLQICMYVPNITLPLARARLVSPDERNNEVSFYAFWVIRVWGGRVIFLPAAPVRNVRHNSSHCHHLGICPPAETRRCSESSLRSGRRVLVPPRPHLETLSLSYLLHCYTGIVRALRLCMYVIYNNAKNQTKLNKTRELKGEKESSSRRRGLTKGEGRRKKKEKKTSTKKAIAHLTVSVPRHAGLHHPQVRPSAPDVSAHQRRRQHHRHHHHHLRSAHEGPRVRAKLARDRARAPTRLHLRHRHRSAAAGGERRVSAWLWLQRSRCGLHLSLRWQRPQSCARPMRRFAAAAHGVLSWEKAMRHETTRPGRAALARARVRPRPTQEWWWCFWTVYPRLCQRRRASRALAPLRGPSPSRRAGLSLAYARVAP